jgi:hypothetical protein
MTAKRWTNADLIAGAAMRGHVLTERTIVEWTKFGLLDHPKHHGSGRGSAAGYRSDNQAELLWALIKQRAGRASKIATLANIPVYLWMGWGESYISLSQVRRAMSTFSDREGSASGRRARESARQHIEMLDLIDVPAVNRRELEDVIIEMSATKWPDLDLFAGRFERALYGVIAPGGTVLVSPIVERIVAAVDARMRAAEAFRAGGKELVSDVILRQVESFYRSTAPEYAARAALSMRDVHQEVANKACATVLLLVGQRLERR